MNDQDPKDPPADDIDEIMAAVQAQIIERKVHHLADTIVDTIPDGWGFALWIFPFGKEQTKVVYTSNSERADMIAAVKEWLRRVETDPTLVPSLARRKSH